MDSEDLERLANLIQKYGYKTVLYEFAEMTARGGGEYERDLADWLQDALNSSAPNGIETLNFYVPETLDPNSM